MDRSDDQQNSGVSERAHRRFCSSYTLWNCGVLETVPGNSVCRNDLLNPLSILVRMTKESKSLCQEQQLQEEAHFDRRSGLPCLAIRLQSPIRIPEM